MGRVVGVAVGLFLFCGCVTTTASLAPAQLRAHAERRLVACLGWDTGMRAPPLQRQACLEESKAFCRGSGLEATCGSSGLWARAGSWSR